MTLAWSNPSKAQAIDQYLRYQTPGLDTAPGVTVASRLQPAYDPQGVRVGEFTLSPLLIESFGYDDNVVGASPARGSPLIETNALLTAKSNWAIDTLNASLMVDNSEYPQQSQQSETNWSAAVGGSHDFGRDTLSLGLSHFNLNQSPRDLDAPALASPISYRVDDVQGSYRITLGRLTLTPGVDGSLYRYDNGIANGQAYLQSYRDRTVYAPSLTANYEWAPGWTLVMVLRDTQADFDTALLNNARENFNDISALAGAAYDVDGVITVRLLGGYEHRAFAASEYRPISAPILEAAATWTPTELTTVTGTAARYIEDSAAELTVGYTETALKLNVDHEYARNILLNAAASAIYDDYAQGGARQSYYMLGAGATWKFNRNIGLVVAYNYSKRQTSGVNLPVVQGPFGSAFGGDYTDNVFTIRVRLGF